jgi:hypothetical protein
VFPNKEVDMSHHSSAGLLRAALDEDRPLDAEEVLDLLRALIRQVASPVVQECLRGARCEIAYLTSTDGPFPEEDEEDEDEDGPDEVLEGDQDGPSGQAA